MLHRSIAYTKTFGNPYQKVTRRLPSLEHHAMLVCSYESMLYYTFIISSLYTSRPMQAYSAHSATEIGDILCNAQCDMLTFMRKTTLISFIDNKRIKCRLLPMLSSCVEANILFNGNTYLKPEINIAAVAEQYRSRVNEICSGGPCVAKHEGLICLARLAL